MKPSERINELFVQIQKETPPKNSEEVVAAAIAIICVYLDEEYEKQKTIRK